MWKSWTWLQYSDEFEITKSWSHSKIHTTFHLLWKHIICLLGKQENFLLLQNQRLRFGLNLSWWHLEPVFITQAHSSSPLHLFLTIPNVIQKRFKYPTQMSKCTKPGLLQHPCMERVGAGKEQLESKDWIYTANHEVNCGCVINQKLMSLLSSENQTTPSRYFHGVNNDGKKWGTSKDWWSLQLQSQ